MFSGFSVGVPGWGASRRRAAASVAVLTSIALLTGCGPDASAGTGSGGSGDSADDPAQISAFCAQVSAHKDRYLSTMKTAHSSDDLSNLVTAAGAIGDLQGMWDDLAMSAPASIASDTKATSAAWTQAMDAATHRDYTAAVLNAAFHGAAVGRVNTYISKHCGPEFAPLGANSADDKLYRALSGGDEKGPIGKTLNATWTDDEGYKYQIAINAATYDPKIDVANAPPGKALFSFTFQADASLLNLTDRRNAKVPDMYPGVEWKRDSLPCHTLPVEAREIGSASYCGLSFQAQVADASPMPPGGARDLKVVVGTILPLVVPESDADKIQAAFEHPDAWSLMARKDTLGPESCVATDQAVCH